MAKRQVTDIMTFVLVVISFGNYYCYDGRAHRLTKGVNLLFKKIIPLMRSADRIMLGTLPYQVV
jgi:hypothetical protein